MPIGALLAALRARPARVLADLLAVRRALDHRVDERVFRRQDEEGRAEDGVGARREDRQVHVQLVDAEEQLGALGAADPVALHQQDTVRPAALELPGVRQQPVSVLRDLEVPLVQHAPYHVGAAALAMRPVL